MVKFSFIALASALAAPSASAGTTKTIKLGHRNLRRGDPATKALLKKAAPYKKGGAEKVHRRAEDAEFEITGSYSLEFSQCIDVQTTDEDLFDEDIIGYAKAGQVVSTKSYVLFHVCTDDTCYLDAEDDLYMVDLGTYLANIATYHANKRSDFCEQCEQNDEYCNPEEEEDEENDEEEGDEEDKDEEDEGEEEGEEGEGEGEDRRMLKKAKRKYSKKIERKLANKNYIDCDQCQANECFVDEEDLDDSVQSQNEIDNQISEWIGQLAECEETGVQWNGMDLYTGAMCSPYGDGVELAVFVNDECTMYTNQKTFASVYNPYANNDGNNANIDYVTYAEEYIKTAFKEVTPCKQVEYDEYNEDENEDENNEEEEENNEASEYCQAVMEEDTVSFSNCQADEDEADEEEDDQYDWSWYSSSAISAQKADDINSVCVALNAMDSESYGAHVYDEEASGSWYTRNKKGAIVYGDEDESGLSGGAIAGIVMVVVAVVGAAMFLATKKKSSAPVDTAYQGGAMS